MLIDRQLLRENRGNSAENNIASFEIIGKNYLDDKKQRYIQQLKECTQSLYQMALRLTRNEADAEDLVADAVVKAWAAFDTLENVAVFRSWIFRILHNCFISDYRKKSIRPPETSYDQLNTDQDDGELLSLLISQSDEFLLWWSNPELEIANQLLNRDIYKAIDELPEVYRLTIILVSVEGLTYDEAAEVLNVPPGTIRSRMKRGRTLLQKSLWQHAKEANLITPSDNEEFS